MEGQMRKWRCTVCGYIHEGDEPPEICPVCGADRSKFVEVDAEEDAAKEADPAEDEIAAAEPETSATDSTPESTVSPSTWDPLFKQVIKHHVHPVSVHIPNGVLPVSVIFIVLAAVFNFSGLSLAAYYNLIFVVISMPLVLFSGYIEWQRKYGGHFTTLFITKMICGAVVSITAITLVIWLYVNPNVAAASSSQRMPFLIVNIIMLAAAATAGYFGGKLVFKD